MRRGKKAHDAKVWRRLRQAVLEEHPRGFRRPGLKEPMRQWDRDHPRLTRPQRELVRTVEKAAKALRKAYHGREKTIDWARLQVDYRRYYRLIDRMERAGLADHPLVEAVRPFKTLMYPGRGRPRKPLSADDRALIKAVKPLLAQGLTLSAVHRHLHQKQLYMASRTALDKRLRRLRLWPVRR